jgi:hypothetical protein
LNESHPNALTVGRLRELLADVPDATVVAIVIPPGTTVDDRLTIFCNAQAEYHRGPVFKLLPSRPLHESPREA